MRQLTKIRHMSLRFVVSLESDIGSFKFTLKDRNSGEINIFEDEVFNNALIDAHRHFKEVMKQDGVNSKLQKRLNHPIYK